MQTTTDHGRHWSLIALRTLIVAVFFWHGVPKAFDWPRAVEKFIGFGLPGFLGPVTGIAEVIAGSMLLLNVVQRPALMVLGVTILGALATVQIPRGITAGFERDLLILLSILVLFFNAPAGRSPERISNRQS
jgi:putative oxidoreductase